jgi:hypothetical protein
MRGDLNVFTRALWNCYHLNLINNSLSKRVLIYMLLLLLIQLVGAGVAQSGYGLHDRAIEVRSSAGAEDFSSSLCDQTGSGAHPASCTMGTGGPFPGGKARPGRDADHSPHLLPRSRIGRSYTPLPPSAFMACSGTALLLLSFYNYCH